MLSSVIMGMIITLAPTVGPVLGGHLTEWLNWRWLFFINVPPGLLVLFLVSRYGDFDKGDRSLTKGFDWIGLAFMGVFLMATQFVLEEGARKNWFEDDLILLLAVTGAVCGAIFVWRSLSYKQPATPSQLGSSSAGEQTKHVPERSRPAPTHLVLGRTQDVEQHPANDGDEQGQQDARAAVAAGQLHGLGSRVGVAGHQQAGGAQAEPSRDALLLVRHILKLQAARGRALRVSARPCSSDLAAGESSRPAPAPGRGGMRSAPGSGPDPGC